MGLFKSKRRQLIALQHRVSDLEIARNAQIQKDRDHHAEVTSEAKRLFDKNLKALARIEAASLASSQCGAFAGCDNEAAARQLLAGVLHNLAAALSTRDWYKDSELQGALKNFNNRLMPE